MLVVGCVFGDECADGCVFGDECAEASNVALNILQILFSMWANFGKQIW